MTPASRKNETNGRIARKLGTLRSPLARRAARYRSISA